MIRKHPVVYVLAAALLFLETESHVNFVYTSVGSRTTQESCHPNRCSTWKSYKIFSFSVPRILSPAMHFFAKQSFLPTFHRLFGSTIGKYEQRVLCNMMQQLGSDFRATSPDPKIQIILKTDGILVINKPWGVRMDGDFEVQQKFNSISSAHDHGSDLA